MSEREDSIVSANSFKRKKRRVTEKAIDNMEKLGYNIIASDENPFCFLGVRGTEIRMIKIILHGPDPGVERLLKKFPCPANCSKEIWIRDSGGKLNIREVK